MWYVVSRIRRPFITLAVVAAAMCATIGGSFAATVTLDGQPVTPVYQRDGHLLIPFRAPMERIGATVDWTAPTATASINGGQLVTVNIGDSNALIKGTPHQLSVAPELIANNAFVPVETLANICGATVTYSADRSSANVVGCTLANINTIAANAAAPSFNLWPWIIGLLVLAALLWAWSRMRTKTAYVTNPTQDGTRTVPTTSNVVRGTVDDYVARLKTALGQMDDTRRASFVQQLSQSVRDNRATIPESLVTSTKTSFDSAAGGSSTAVSALIDRLGDQPQLLQMAAKKFATLYPGTLGSLVEGVASR